jgi:transposase
VGSRVELFEQIRRDRDREGLSIRALARRHGVHRRAVRRALASPLPPPKRPPSRRPAPKLGPFRALVDAWLEADREAPRKQRHTAKRIHRRLVDEHGAEVAETTVRDYVRRRRRELGLAVAEVFVPQVHAPAAEAEVDWGRAWVDLAGVRTEVYLFYLRSCYSGAAFCAASLVESQQAFLELHARAFEWFGGVFELIRYDNLRAAVKKVLRGRRRVESDRFIALRSHYLYESSFTTPGVDGAHEKGGVEGEVGRFRRNHLVPVPAVADLAELDALLLAGCEADLERRISGRAVTVGEALEAERPRLRALPAEPFDASESATPRVDSKSLVTVRRNRYSVPVALAGLRVAARVGAREITIIHDGREVARHERLHGHFGTSARLDHYLELLARKPGALERSLPLHQERERDAWPGCFDELWRALAQRYGRSDAARQMVDVLMLCREHGPERIALAVRGALVAGAHDGRAIAVLARRAERRQPAVIDIDERLARAGSPPGELTDYDALIEETRP